MSALGEARRRDSLARGARDGTACLRSCALEHRGFRPPPPSSSHAPPRPWPCVHLLRGLSHFTEPTSVSRLQQHCDSEGQFVHSSSSVASLREGATAAVAAQSFPSVSAAGVGSLVASSLQQLNRARGAVRAVLPLSRFTGSDVLSAGVAAAVCASAACAG